MLKLTFGTPEYHVPSRYCKGFNYAPTDIKFPTEQISFRTNNRGCVLSFPLDNDTQIYGFGLQLKQFNHRGRKLKLSVNADPMAPTGDSHAPVPFFVTNKGWGMYVDTARYAEFYCGNQMNSAFGGGQAQKTASDMGNEVAATSTKELYALRREADQCMTIQIPGSQGVEVYIIEGDTITDIVSQYNMLSGGGCEVPEWGLGVLYRCYSRYTDKQVLGIVDEMHAKDIPLHIIGLEPGWQTRTYSCSYLWSDLFPDPAAFLSEMKSRGIHVNLWEHAFTHPTAPIHDALAPYSADTLVWGGLVPDFSLPEARKIFANHQRTLVNAGVDGFKLDECDSSDYTGSWSFPLSAQFPSGMDGEQYHSLFGLLTCQVLMDALDGKPTLSEVRNMGALAAPYPFVLYSDLYDHMDFIRGVTTAPFSGLLWSPELRDAGSKEELLRRLQVVVFSIQCLINAWYCPDLPWREFACEDEVRELLKLRVQLMPRLRESFKIYKATGKPPIRALVMDYTHDPEVANMDDEYLFCEDLLVAPIAAGQGNTRKVYLPQGAWADFFTGEEITPGWLEVTTEGIPVYRKLN